jgi:Flp pilus assembly protein TadB
MTFTRGYTATFILGSILVLSSCFGARETPAERERNSDTAAGKAGQAAHKVAKEGEKAAKEVSRKLDEAAHQAKDGWQKAAQNDKKQ